MPLLSDLFYCVFYTQNLNDSQKGALGYYYQGDNCLFIVKLLIFTSMVVIIWCLLDCVIICCFFF